MCQFSEAARTALPELHHIDDAQGNREPKGYLWIDAKDQLDSELNASSTDDNRALEWEQIVRDYLDVMSSPEKFATEFYDKDFLTSAEEKFKDQSPFYIFHGLKSVPDGKPVKSEIEDNRSAFKLAPDSTYELSFYQYHPSRDFPKVQLSLSTTHDGAKIVGNQSHAFNTRYDVKRFTLSTTSALSGASGNILVSRIFADGASDTPLDDLYLHYRVASSKGKIALYILAIAVLFAFPHLMILWNSTPAAGWAQYLIVAVVALGLGAIATLKDLLQLK